jgi:protein tyrosine phosphatase
LFLRDTYKRSQESQQAFDQLLNRFQNSLKFEDNHIELLNKVKEALDYINTDEKIQSKIEIFFKNK